jgi:hypothetical protein
MADPIDLERVEHESALEGAKVSVSPENRLIVEFRINELIKKFVPGGAVASSCGGCGGCMGCGH